MDKSLRCSAQFLVGGVGRRAPGCKIALQVPESTQRGTFASAGARAWHLGFRRRHAEEVVTMLTIKQAASAFLANDKVAVTGVSRSPKGGHGSNFIYKRLRDRGYQVFAVNPNADQVEGDKCYHDLTEIPGGVQAVVLGTKPEAAEATIRSCVELGVKYAWMHGPAFGPGSVCTEAAVYGREQGMTVIDGGCPLMFGPTADFGHKLLRLFAGSKVPKTV